MMPVPVEHVLTLSAILFVTGVAGVILRRNAIIVFMHVELMLNAVNLAFVAISAAMGSMTGMVFVFFILVVAAAEAVIGLAIMVEIFRNKQTLNIDELNLLKW